MLHIHETTSLKGEEEGGDLGTLEMSRIWRTKGKRNCT